LSYAIELLSERHNRESFDCGVEPLNRYLQKQASQDIRRNVATLYVATPVSSVSVRAEIAGYYSLANTGIFQVDLPDELKRKMPRYKILPAVLLGRLAVDLRHRERKLGEQLLSDAFKTSLNSPTAWTFFVTDAKDDKSRTFYERFGFKPLKDDPNHLCITRHEMFNAAMEL